MVENTSTVGENDWLVDCEQCGFREVEETREKAGRVFGEHLEEEGHWAIITLNYDEM